MHEAATDHERVLLRDVAEPMDGAFVDGPFGSNLKSDEYVEAGVRLIQLQNIGEGYWKDDNKKYITDLKFRSLARHGAIPGDIAIAKMAEPVARACVVPGAREQYVVVADCIRLRVDKTRFDPRYIVRAINSHVTRTEAESKSIGSTRIRINLGTLKSVGCLVPPLRQQQTIAEVLDTLDTTIHQTEGIIEKLKQVKQGLLHDLLTRGIDANGELRPPQRQAPHLYKDSPLGWIPSEWQSSTVADEFDVTSGITLGPHRVPRSNARKYLRVANVQRDRIDLTDVAELGASDSEVACRELMPGDLLIVEGHASTDEIGRCAMANELVRGYTFQNHLFRLRAVRLSAAFGLYWMNSGGVRSYWRTEAATSSGLNTINRSKLSRVLVAIPGGEEQRRIVSTVVAMDKRLSSERAQLSKLRAQKSGLMDDLLTGRVRVTPLLDTTSS